MKTLKAPSKFFVGALVAVGLVAMLVTVASGAGPYKELATFSGNEKACGSTKATGCTFAIKTLTAPEMRIKITGGEEVRIECQLNGKGTVWNPGGSPPKENDSIDALELLKCKVAGSECKVTPEVKGLPWPTMATREGPGGAFADQITIPKGGLKLKLEGKCPAKTGTYEPAGNINAKTVNAEQPECDPATYAHCTYDELQKQNSGELPVEKEEKEVGTATLGGEAFFVCLAGGACTEKENQITVK